MPEWAIVTGAGSGIGRYLAVSLCRKSIPVLGVGRREDPLAETSEIITASGHSGFRYVSADVGSEAGRRDVVQALPAEAQVTILAHVAGAYPIAPVSELSYEQWRAAFEVNVDARLFLTRALLPFFTKGSRVALMQSGTGETPRIGAIAACASMAASIMVRRCLQKELAGKGIYVSSVKPGPVNSDMLKQTLSADPSVFPDMLAMRAIPLVAPETCGRFMAWWLTETSIDRFMEEGWNLEDPEHHPEWLDADDPYERRHMS